MSSNKITSIEKVQDVQVYFVEFEYDGIELSATIEKFSDKIKDTYHLSVISITDDKIENYNTDEIRGWLLHNPQLKLQ
jgi:hypothetical protein